jgi:hypothetical protein
MKHYCQKRLYFFEIKKRGDNNCDICKPIKSDLNVFNELKRLPDPILGPDKHYISFSKVYVTEITEEYCPSLQKRKSRNMPNNIEKKEGNDMDFNPTAQFAKNVRTVIKCTECNKLRVLYAHRKISEEEYHLLQSFLESVKYVCGLLFKRLTELSFSKGISVDTHVKTNNVCEIH